MGKRNNKQIVGARIGLYDVLYECDFKSNDGHRMFHIKCSECGWETDARMHQINYLSKQCTHINNAKGYSYRHGHHIKNAKLNKIFSGIINRCYNPNEKSYRWYGCKGIKVYQEWIDNPESFEEWAIKNGYEDGLTIDRIEEDKDYCPDNCRWITREDNSKYKSTTALLVVDDMVYTGREWADVLSLGTNTINTMLRKYPKEKVIEFIRRRLKDMAKTRPYKTTWMKVYGLE